VGRQDSPLFERFFLGGPNSLRGWRFRQISPVDSSGQQTGGNSEVLGNVEYIIPLPFNLRLALFVDVGNVYGFSTPFDLTNLKADVGAGIRWVSPFGPIRVDYGLDHPVPARHRAIQCSVGSLFDGPAVGAENQHATAPSAVVVASRWRPAWIAAASPSPGAPRRRLDRHPARAGLARARQRRATPAAATPATI
jgi:hypothetical protein